MADRCYKRKRLVPKDIRGSCRNLSHCCDRYSQEGPYPWGPHPSKNSKRVQRPADGLVLWSFARFARDFDDAQYFKADLRRLHWVIISVTDPVPGDDLNSRLFEAVIDWKNAVYPQDLSKNVKRGLHDLVRAGSAPGGIPPRGHKSKLVTIEKSGKPHQVAKWVKDSGLWDAARLAWDMRANGATYGEIHQATHLYKSMNCYTTFFRNKAYLGVLRCGEVEVAGAIPTMIDKETWDKVQARMDKHGAARKGKTWTHNHPRRVRSPYLLLVLLFCGICGAPMSGGVDRPRGGADRHKNPYFYYRCNSRANQRSGCPMGKIKMELVDQAVLAAVTRDILTPANVQLLVSQINEELNQGHD